MPGEDIFAPDEITINYLKGREFAPKGSDWEAAVGAWKKLKSDPDAVFDREIRFSAEEIEPMITYGTNPGMGIPVTGIVPDGSVYQTGKNHLRQGSEIYGGGTRKTAARQKN